MASVKKITMREYNGTDYDTLYPKTIASQVDGVYNKTEVDALLRKKPNPNLLDNWYFVNPVNQRGQTSYTGGVYTIDRWLTDTPTSSDSYAVTVNDGYITFNIASAQSLWQKTEYKTSQFIGKQMTLSIMMKDDVNTVGSITFTVQNGLSYSEYVYGSLALNVTDVNGYLWFRCYCLEPKAFNIIAMKAELGDTQTLAHQDANGNWVLNEIPDYSEQLLRCQRYFNVIRAVSVNARYGYGLCTGNDIFLFVPINVPLRAVPSITMVGDFLTWESSIAKPCTFRAFDSLSTNGVTFTVTSGVMYAGKTYQLLDAGTGNSAIILDANL